ncbi:MAG: hypothetical protein KAT70_05895 [Thermoplasmata archaeon]|nr:hypothetical protein [Thermoplasmata archaeon]
MSKPRPVKVWLALLGYVILPTVVIGRMLIVYPELPAQRLLGILLSAVAVGSVLVLLAYGSSHHPRGSSARLALNLAFVAGTIIWFLAMMGWSTTLHMSYGEFAFQLHLSNYLWLLITVGLLNSVYYVAEARALHVGQAESDRTEQATIGGSEGSAVGQPA